MMRTCSKRTCTSWTFMDSDRCFDHGERVGLWAAWFIFCALFGLGLTAFGVWVVLVLLAWVTSK